MRKLLTFGSLIITTACLTYLLVFNHFTGEFPWDESVPEDEIHEKLYSKILSEDREIIVYLPRDYDSLKQYPVMYVLDGGSQHSPMVTAFDVLAAAGYLSSTIVVGIPNSSDESRQRDYTPPYMKMDIDDLESPLGKGDQFLSFVENELIPLVEARYSVSTQRLFCGNSRGGLLVMHSLLYNADMFQGRFCLSSPFWREQEIMVDKVGDFLSTKDSLDTFIYMSAGDRETDRIKNGMASMTSLFRKNKIPGLLWHSEYTRNADHQTNSKNSAASAVGKWSRYVSPRIADQ
jgi:predicted alpha/beta superfamily hydrolase